jgi:hypothetical protein
MDDMLRQLLWTEWNVHGFDSAAGAVDLVGRCERLLALTGGLQTAASSSTSEATCLQEDHAELQVLLQDLSSFLSQLKEAKIAPNHRWDKWWEQGSKYARLLHAISNRLNDFMVNYLHHIWQVVAEDTDGTWEPPTVEALKLCKPVLCDEATTIWNTVNDCKRLASASTRSTGTASTVSLDSSLRSHDSNAEECDNAWKSSQSTAPLQWDFSPRSLPTSGWGSNGGVLRRRQDRIDQYRQTQLLRDLPSQDIPVVSLKIVLAQLEAGDTSPTIVAGKTAMMTLGYLGALMVSPLAMTFGLSAKEAFQETPLEAAAVLCHYLLEFELANGMVGTIENCVQDIYLYGGRSTRKEQHVVCTVPMLPGAVGSPDSLTRPLLLRDLIRFRNEQRQRPYRLFENNCKHFCLQALTGGQLFPTPTNYSRKEFLQVFFALCQGCYVAKESFDLFHRPALPLAQPPAEEQDQEEDPMMERSDRYDHLVATMVQLDLEYDDWE